MRAPAITLCLAALLAGCAVHPLIDVGAAGAGPDKASPAYRFALATDPEAPSDKLVLPLVESRLAAKGMKRQDEGARYVVEVGYTARPLETGAYNGAAPADKTQSPDWLAAPGVKRRHGSKPESICSVSLRFVDSTTGAEAYRVHAAQQWTQTECASVAPQLLDLALADIPLPPPAPKK